MSKTLEFEFDIGDEAFVVEFLKKMITVDVVSNRWHDSCGTLYGFRDAGKEVDHRQVHSTPESALECYLKMIKDELAFSSSSCIKIKRLCQK